LDYLNFLRISDFFLLRSLTLPARRSLVC
jgi:hypothetical protein